MKPKTKKTHPATVTTLANSPNWPVPLALFAAAALVYLPALNGQFVWDDEVAIHYNTLLRGFDGLRQIWTSIGAIPGEEHYWPLTYSILWLEWNVWQGHPAGFHLLNFALHGVITVQIYRIARRIGVLGAAIGAALFALHPVHAEVAAWIISIKDLLATLLSLVCVELYLIARERGGSKWLAWGALAAAAAMLCKSSPVTLAATIAILAWYHRGRIDRRDWLWIGVIGAITIGIGIADLSVVRSRDFARTSPVPDLIDRVMQSGWVFLLYVKNLLWPFGLGPAYPQFDLDRARPLDWLPLGLAVAATVSLWLARAKIGRGPLACWLFYGVSLSPVIGLIYFNYLGISPAADRYQYLASIGPLLLAGAVLGRAIQTRAASRTHWRIATALLLAGLGILSWRQADVFKNSEAFLRRGTATAPKSAYMRQLLGTHYLRLQRYGDAEALLRESLRIEPNDWEAVCNLGMALVWQGRERDAAVVYDEALERGCDECGLLSNYALLLATTPDAALRNPKKAVELGQRSVQNPRDIDSRYWLHLSLALEADGRIEDALDAAKKARELAEKQQLPDVKDKADQAISKLQKTAGNSQAYKTILPPS